MTEFQTVINSIAGIAYLYQGESLDDAVQAAEEFDSHPRDRVEVWVDGSSEEPIFWQDHAAVQEWKDKHE